MSSNVAFASKSLLKAGIKVLATLISTFVLPLTSSTHFAHGAPAQYPPSPGIQTPIKTNTFTVAPLKPNSPTTSTVSVAKPTFNRPTGSESTQVNRNVPIQILVKNLPTGEPTSMTLTDIFGKTIKLPSVLVNSNGVVKVPQLTIKVPGIYKIKIRTSAGTKTINVIVK